MGLTPKSLEEIAAEYVEGLREYSRSQVELWKKIPWLALQAEGISGFSDERASRYGTGYLRLLVEGGSYRIFLDLDTGEICSSRYPIQLAPDHDVMKLTPADLDAQAYIDELVEYGSRPIGSYYNKDEILEWRRKMAEANNVTERYERKGPRAKETPFQWD